MPLARELVYFRTMLRTALAACFTLALAGCPTKEPPPGYESGAPAASPAPAAAASATLKGCAGFESEDAQEEAKRAARSGDKEGFKVIAIAKGRHMNDGEEVRVTGHGEKLGTRRVVDANGKAWFIDMECIKK